MVPPGQTCPLTHWAQVDEPAGDAYAPAAQPLCKVPFTHTDPKGHTTHVEEVVAPRLSEYVPFPHETHVDEEVAFSVDEYVPAAHAVQLAREVAFTMVFEYVPGGHASGDVLLMGQ